MKKLNCKKCDYEWIPRKKDVQECPRCKSRYWNTVQQVEDLRECINCNRNFQLLHRHHTNYSKDETILVCLSCHKKIHLDKNNKFYPKDLRFEKRPIV